MSETRFHTKGTNGNVTDGRSSMFNNGRVPRSPGGGVASRRAAGVRHSEGRGYNFKCSRGGGCEDRATIFGKTIEDIQGDAQLGFVFRISRGMLSLACCSRLEQCGNFGKFGRWSIRTEKGQPTEFIRRGFHVPWMARAAEYFVRGIA